MSAPGKAGAVAIILVLAALMGAQEPPRPAVTAVPGPATLNEVKGQVSISLPDGSTPAPQRGQVLPPATRIETEKGSALLALQDGSQVLIKSHARVVLRAPGQDRGYFLELLMGKIVAKVRQKLGADPPFRLGTPTAVITVRGTRFEVEVTKKNKTLVYVYEGIVEVNGFAPQSRPVMLRPGFSTEVGRDRGPDQPRQLAPGPGADMQGEGRFGQRGEPEDTQHAPTRPQGQAGEGPD